MHDAGWIDMREVVFYLFHQVLRVSNPVAVHTGTGCFVVSQVAVQRLDEFDALT